MANADVETDEDPKTKCVICWQILGSKKQLLRGMKCLRFEIRQKLKSVLPAPDFRALYNEKIFSEPRICNLCFVTIKQIPKGLGKLQDLLGEPVNIKLYRPDRKAWDVPFDDSLQSEMYTQSTYSAPILASKSQSKPKGPKIGPKFTKTRKPSSLSVKKDIKPTSNKNIQQRRGKGSQSLESLCVVNASTGETEYETSEEKQKENEDSVTTLGSNKAFGRENCYLGQNSESATPRKERNMPDENFEVDAPLSLFVDEKGQQDSPLEAPLIPDGDQIITCQTDLNRARPRRKSSMPLAKTEAPSSEIAVCRSTRTRSRKMNLLEEKQILSDTQTSRHKEKLKKVNSLSVLDHTNDSEDPTSVTISQKRLRQGASRKRPRETSAEPVSKRKKENEIKAKRKQNQSSKKRENIEVKMPRKINRSVRTKMNSVKVEEHAFKGGKTTLKVDIPDRLCSSSKEHLCELIKKVNKYIMEKSRTPTMIKCCEDNCDHAYPSWQFLALHIKYYHYDGSLPLRDEFMQTISLLTDELLLQAKLPYKCTQSGCDLSFSSENNLQAHESFHDSSFKHICGFPDCGKAFKLPVSLQVHFRTHTGERPFSCNIPGCERSFKHRSDLTMHQRRHTGEKPHKCDYEGCDKAFTTSTELSDHKNTHSQDTSFCCDLCGKQFVGKRGLYNHKRKLHAVGRPGIYKCTFEGCNSSFVTRDKYEIHLCSHSPERILYCEKCGKQFGCQRYLDVHYKVHERNERNALNPPERVVACEVAGCDRKFTCRVYMKRHILSYHHGRRPRPVPGVFYTCPVDGCSKKFNLKSTLSRHNLLVHKVGDYKLHRAVVRYPCNYDGCGKQFNRKNLLEEHMVMEHGRPSKRSLPLQTREQDYLERICVHCGMVLTDAQLSRHVKVYHSEKAVRERKETSPFPCHLKGCEMEFNNLEERQAHVQFHTENPPYRCEVDDCRQTFYLLKNLDNHLWNHSKKTSTCDFEGCSQTFSDQLQLAKHSKIHYDGKMKCPWRNCGNWFTAMGTLKQHFLAHSRSLKANFGSDFVCDICDRVFSSKYGLKNHKRTHNEEIAGATVTSGTLNYVCEEPGCQAQFSQHKLFFDHFLLHYTNTPSMCDFEGCNQKFPSLLLMSKHGKFHYNGKYICPWPDCSKTFASSFFQVKRHVYKHLMSNPSIAANRPHICNQCDMMFRYPNNLTNHMAQHTEKSDYVCTVCGKKFHHNHLKRHMLTHRTEKPHECQHCGVRYGTVNGLRFHILQKHKIGKWPFKCSFCDKGFISSTEMRRHLPSHTKEKPFSCEQCGVKFATHTGYKGHMRKHTGQKYVCDVEGCGKVYTTPLSMRGHKAQHAGFSKTCPYCGKMYKNPYGHKCKASREAKKKVVKQDTVIRPLVPVPAPLPAVSTFQSPPMVMPTQSATQDLQIHQSAGTMMVSNPTTLSHPHILPSNLPQTIQLGIPQGLPQVLPQVIPNQGMMQERVQPLPMDMTRGTPMDMTGDYTFNNCVVYWESQNMS